MREGDLPLFNHDIQQLQKIMRFLSEQLGLDFDSLCRLFIKGAQVNKAQHGCIVIAHDAA